MTDKKLKSPDLTRFGFYLFPKVYKGVMGFERAHGLLFLDSKGRIEPSLAKKIGMTHLLNSAHSVLYAINPIDGKYPSASELLKSLSLGSIAKQRLITKADLRKEFLDECLQGGIALDSLDESVFIGLNKDGHEVYESKSGRYLTDEKGLDHREVALQQLLYAVDENGILVEKQAEYCLESLFKFHLDITDDGDNVDFIYEPDFANFVRTVTKIPPIKYPKISGYEPIPFYSPENQTSKTSMMSKIIDILEKLEAKLLVDLDYYDDTAFEQYFHHIYYRRLPATKQGFQTNLPAPLIVMLIKLMQFSRVKMPHIISPYVGSYALLAGLVKLKQEGCDVTIGEIYSDQQHEFNLFLTDVEAGNLVVHSKVDSYDFHGSITYLKTGDTSPSVLIPTTNHHTYRNDIAEIIDILDRRLPDGRSIFITAVDNEGNLGYVDEDSIELLFHLYENYQNVLVFDCNQALSDPSRYTCEYRIYIIGEMSDDAKILNEKELDELSTSPSVHIVDNPNDFYQICNSYASEIAAVDISSVDLMDNLLGIIDEEGYGHCDDDHMQATDDKDDAPVKDSVDLTKNNDTSHIHSVSGVIADEAIIEKHNADDNQVKNSFEGADDGAQTGSSEDEGSGGEGLVEQGSDNDDLVDDNISNDEPDIEDDDETENFDDDVPDDMVDASEYEEPPQMDGFDDPTDVEAKIHNGFRR